MQDEPINQPTDVGGGTSPPVPTVPATGEGQTGVPQPPPPAAPPPPVVPTGEVNTPDTSSQ